MELPKSSLRANRFRRGAVKVPAQAVVISYPSAGRVHVIPRSKATENKRFLHVNYVNSADYEPLPAPGYVDHPVPHAASGAELRRQKRRFTHFF